MKNKFANYTFGEKYLLKEEIATSSLFHVYKALHLFLNKEVIIKILRIDIVKDQRDVPILREVASEVLEQLRQVAALEGHPNINWILDIDKEMDGKILYFVVDYLENDLEKMIKSRDKLELDEAFRIAEGMLSALDYAHSHGIAHKNLKPSTVRFSGDNMVITDFGLGSIAQ
jgi:serine/threonine protein kinase